MTQFFEVRVRPTFYLVGLLIFPTCLLGCGGGGELDKVIVEGNATFDGTPIPNGEIRFYPIENTLGAVSGGPIKDGKYIAKGRGGVPVGMHRVEIKGYRAPKGKVSADIEGGPAEQYLPAKYNAESELTAEVSSDNRTIDFKLTSD